MRCIPGMAQVLLGFHAQQQEQLASTMQQSGSLVTDLTQACSPQREVAMPPMLVSTKALPAKVEILGRISQSTRIFKGNHMRYAAIRAQVCRC